MYSRFTNGPPCYTSQFYKFILRQWGWVFISLRRRALDGSCQRVTSVFVSFSGLHESEQCRCIVDVVSVLVITVGTL